MTLHNLLPHQRLVEKEAQRAIYEIIAPANLLYFEGHFPQAPLLPGVVQVHWAIAYGRQCFTLPSAFHALHALKFQHIIQPEIPIRLELVHDPIKSSLTFRYTSEAGQHSTGRILFGESHV